MSDWPHGDPVSLMNFYGPPGRGAMGKVIVPWRMYEADTRTPVPTFLMHVRCVPVMNILLQNIWDHYGRSQKAIEEVGMHLWGGALNVRKVRGGSGWSVHAYGAAVDFDPDHNGMTTNPKASYRMPQAVIDEFKAAGATWGGDFRPRRDPMHFEFCHYGPHSPAKAATPAKKIVRPKLRSKRIIRRPIRRRRRR